MSVVRWRATFMALAVALAGGQFLDFLTAQGLSSLEPKGAFAEVNPLLAQIADPIARQYVGLALKIALVALIIWVATLQRRRLVAAALLLGGTVAGLFGAWSNTHPWWG